MAATVRPIRSGVTSPWTEQPSKSHSVSPDWWDTRASCYSWSRIWLQGEQPPLGAQISASALGFTRASLLMLRNDFLDLQLPRCLREDECRRAAPGGEGSAGLG